MKNKILILICLFSVINSKTVLYGQNSENNVVLEQIGLFTDRTMYITGEPIQFSSTILFQRTLSKVIYIELISPDGKRITSDKFPVLNSKSAGYINIPVDLISGVYYLKAYTKFMRNFGSEFYHFTSIKIINPFKSDVLPVSGENNVIDSQGIAGNIASKDSVFNIALDKQIYSLREKVHVKINKTGTIQDSISLICITVVPESIIFETGKQIFLQKRVLPKTFFSAETRGVTISGQLVDLNINKPLVNKKVNLSIIGDKDLNALLTNSEGHFSFSLPFFYGSKDLFLSTESLEGINPSILIENDFCTNPINLPSIGLKLTEDERNMVYNFATNIQIGSHFQFDTISNLSNELSTKKSFYGVPNETIVLDNFIQLPNLEEYLNELPFMVKVRKHKGHKYFKIYGSQSEMAINEPLIMIDWVAIDEVDKILSVSPSGIQSIEIINVPYVKGNIIYGGIINFISRNGDFAGINLPSSGTFINYSFYSVNRILPEQEFLDVRTPDTRNTLYWNSRLILNSENSCNLSFNTSDVPGKYKIVLRGIKKSGESFIQTISFEVR